MTTQGPAPAASIGDKPTASVDVSTPARRKLAVSPAIGPLPPLHVAPPPSRTTVRLLQRAAAWAARLTGSPTRHRYPDLAGE
jgi:hypothetical protein